MACRYPQPATALAATVDEGLTWDNVLGSRLRSCTLHSGLWDLIERHHPVPSDSLRLRFSGVRFRPIASELSAVPHPGDMTSTLVKNLCLSQWEAEGPAPSQTFLLFSSQDFKS